MKKIILLFLLITSLLSAKEIDIDQSEKLFSKYGKQISQIRVIEKQSGEKISIGTGFFISDDGYIATNYHVIQQALEYPEKFILELINHDQTKENLEIINFDIIHDLSILKTSKKNTDFLKFSTQTLKKGQKIYSLGNPKDLGFSIVEGINNGLLGNRRAERIFFSGSINPGMSGGAAINIEGEVVGINVASEGEQISYLVPVKYLIKLFERVQNGESIDLKNYFKIAGAQLFEFQNEFMSETLDSEWTLEPFGDAMIVKSPAEYFKAWGNTAIDKKSLYNISISGIQTQDRIYINSDLQMEQIYLKYLWLDTDQVSSYHFYNILQSYAKEILASSFAKEENLTEWVTHSDFLSNNDMNWKTIFAIRQYKNFPELYDVAMIATTLDFQKKGLILKIRIKGISKENALVFPHRLLEKIEWKK